MSSYLTRPQIKDIRYLGYITPKSEVLRVFNNKGNLVGRMTVKKEFVNGDDIYYPNKTDYYSLYIKRLFVEDEFRGKGAGRAFINMAKRISYDRGCHGKIHLIAQALDGKNHPQKFYRKMCFESQNKYHIELIDKSIKENTELPGMRWITPMYYPLTNKT